MQQSLSGLIKISDAITPAEGVAGATPLNGATLSMAGFHSVMAIVKFGVITANAVTSIKGQQSAVSAFSNPDDLDGSTVTVADDDDGKTFVVDFKRVKKPFFRIVVGRGTQNAVVSWAMYQQYDARKRPITQNGAGIGSVVVVVDPIVAT